jgi:Rrf2 family transcriptional regulator, iron-sulfur cluster assembly transcription factor
MVTREVDYAIRMVVAMVRRGTGATVSTAELADEMEIPFRFLRRIVRKLVEAKIVTSHRGSGGGVRLAVPGKRLRLPDVIDAIAPNSLKLNTCLVDPRNCRRSGFCTVHPAMNRLQDILERQLRSITFDKLV